MAYISHGMLVMTMSWEENDAGRDAIEASCEAERISYEVRLNRAGLALDATEIRVCLAWAKRVCNTHMARQAEAMLVGEPYWTAVKS